MKLNLFEGSFKLFAISLFLVTTIFILEITQSLHAFNTVGYVIVIMFMAQHPREKWAIVILGIITTVYVFLGYYFNDSEPSHDLGVMLNHILAALIIWLTIYFSSRIGKSQILEKEQKEMLNAVFNSGNQSVIIANSSGDIVMMNSFSETLFGYASGELNGTKIENLIPTDLRSIHPIKYQKFISKPTTRTMGKAMESIAKRKDGSEFPVEISVGHFASKNETFAVAFINDLTEKKKAEENVNYEQKLAQTYFELSPILFLALDNTGKVLSINSNGCKLLGYTKEEVIGKNWFKTFLATEEDGNTISYFGKLRNNEIAKSYHENSVLNSTGEEIMIGWRTAVVKDRSGNTAVILGAGADITESKKQERMTIAHHEYIQELNDQLESKIRSRTARLNEVVLQLQEVNHELERNQRLFKAVLHHFPNGVIGVLDKEMKYIFVDGQELQNIGLSGYNKGERMFDKAHPALSMEAENRLKKVFSGAHISYNIELDEQSYAINSVPLQDEVNQINEIIVVIRNTTDEKKVERELLKSIEKERELSEMKSKFVTMASHEFRTPLTTILSSVFLLENYTGEELEIKKPTHLAKIKRSVNNLTNLLNDFMSLGKLEEGRIKPSYTDINIRELLGELVPEMEMVRPGEQSIRCECSGTEGNVQLDKQLLRSILLNLIGNAIKYSPATAEIKVSVTSNEQELIIKVIDHGIGIPMEEQRHIFKRFFRAHNAVNFDGTGLGLNIIKKYIRLMKGTIEFQSKLNEGTTFTVTLPRIISSKEKLTEHKTQML